MARIDPLPREDLAEHEDFFQAAEQFMGFVPNSLFTMARVPGLFDAFSTLTRTVFFNDLISPQLVQMLAFMSSAGSGCRYCQAHTAKSVGNLGVPEEKVAALWEFETSEHFDDAERAALRLAFNAGQAPNAVTDADFAACKEHYTDDQIAAIVASISIFGYLNRWNDTMATDLEDVPAGFADRVLVDGGWDAGKHRH